jgi:alkylated DNA repair dioxygenase AlkB
LPDTRVKPEKAVSSRSTLTTPAFVLKMAPKRRPRAAAATPLLSGLFESDFMTDLFGSPPPLLHLPLPGAQLDYYAKVELEQAPQVILQRLIDDIAWREESITLWGKTHLQPRLIAWHGDAGMDYTYSGVRFAAQPWSPDLFKLKQKIEQISGHKYNSVLLNYYRDQHDSMGFHSDNERELGPRPSIASLSLGQERILVFKHKTDKTLRPYKLRLASGSLLIMQGETQQNWVHGIAKLTEPCGPRVNLTFRQITP